MSVLLAALHGACGSKTASAPTAPTVVDAISPLVDSASVCAPSGSAPTGPVPGPGPYYHQVALADTSDGLVLSGARQVLDHASVPDGVSVADGRILLYYVNGAESATWVAEIVGGSARPIGPITLNGVARPRGVVDPDVRRVGGRVRLAYLGGFGPPMAGGTGRAICLAESTDGVNFTMIGEALSMGAELWTDPSMVPLADGTWLIAVSAGMQTVLARSSDGLHFSVESRVPYGGIPELAVLGGVVRLYVCQGGIQAYRSTDAGRTWSHEALVLSGRGIVCDPSLVEGAGLFVYKTG